MHHNCSVCFEVSLIFTFTVHRLLWKRIWYIFKDTLIHTDLWWDPCTVCIFYFMHTLNSMLFRLGLYFRWGLYLHVGLCFVQYLFDSMKDITVMPCGHTMHLECLREMHRHAQWVAPLTWKEGFACHFSLECCRNECFILRFLSCANNLSSGRHQGIWQVCAVWFLDIWVCALWEWVLSVLWFDSWFKSWKVEDQ
jgi:hypothetical protein